MKSLSLIKKDLRVTVSSLKYRSHNLTDKNKTDD